MVDVDWWMCLHTWQGVGGRILDHFCKREMVLLENKLLRMIRKAIKISNLYDGERQIQIY